MPKVFGLLIPLMLSTVLIDVTTSLIIGLFVCISILGLWVIYQSFQQERFLRWLKEIRPIKQVRTAMVFGS